MFNLCCRNGDAYAGEYFADKMHGFGVYSFANGHKYEGSWHEGKRQGFGVYTFRNGDTRSGHWQNGVLDISPPVPEYRSKVLTAIQVMHLSKLFFYPSRKPIQPEPFDNLLTCFDLSILPLLPSILH